MSKPTGLAARLREAGLYRLYDRVRRILRGAGISEVVFHPRVREVLEQVLATREYLTTSEDVILRQCLFEGGLPGEDAIPMGVPAGWHETPVDNGQSNYAKGHESEVPHVA